MYKQLRQGRMLFAMLFCYLMTAFLLVAYFSPFSLPFMQRGSKSVVLSASQTPVNRAPVSPEIVAGKPVRIKVPAAHIDVAIADGVYDTKRQTWTLSSDKAHYAVATPYANNHEGNTFIYGHNRRAVFAALPSIETGDSAYIETDNGKRFHYVLRSIKDVDPNDVSLFAYKGKPILTVQTCAGTWYENRRLFTFDFISVEDQI